MRKKDLNNIAYLAGVGELRKELEQAIDQVDIGALMEIDIKDQESFIDVATFIEKVNNIEKLTECWVTLNRIYEEVIRSRTDDMIRRMPMVEDKCIKLGARMIDVSTLKNIRYKIRSIERLPSKVAAFSRYNAHIIKSIIRATNAPVQIGGDTQ